MPGTIKMVIEKNGAVKSDMSGFTSCEQKTSELLKKLDLEASDIELKEEVEGVQSLNSLQDRVIFKK